MTDSVPLVLRRATRSDVPALVGLFAEDELSTADDGGELAPYLRAFDAIDADPAHLLVVAEAGGEVVGTLQLSVLISMARRGALRGQLEAVHVRADHRGSGIGSAMVRWAVRPQAAAGTPIDTTRTEAFPRGDA